MSTPYLPTTRDERRKRRDDAYRAIGRYMVAFSRLISVMRVLVAEYVVGPEGDPSVAEDLMGDVGAKNIADAYFGLIRRRGGLDVVEAQMEVLLRKRVVTEGGSIVQTRNDIAHGDWWVGIFGVNSDEGGGLLVRTKTSRASGAAAVAEEMTAKQLEQMADEIVDLTNTLAEFGRLALGLAVSRRDEPLQQTRTSIGEFRIRDVYSLTGEGHSGVWADRLVRNGPSAGIVLPVHLAHYEEDF